MYRDRSDADRPVLDPMFIAGCTCVLGFTLLVATILGPSAPHVAVHTIFGWCFFGGAVTAFFLGIFAMSIADGRQHELEARKGERVLVPFKRVVRPRAPAARQGVQAAASGAEE